MVLGMTRPKAYTVISKGTLDGRQYPANQLQSKQETKLPGGDTIEWRWFSLDVTGVRGVISWNSITGVGGESSCIIGIDESFSKSAKSKETIRT